MIEKDDWRLSGQERYMQGLTLQWKTYKKPRESWDHDHCSFCWVTITDDDFAKVIHEAYATADNKYWVCKECFADFKDMFGWKLKE